MSFPDNTFDAVYAIEATVHAPSLEGVYSQIYRVLPRFEETFAIYSIVIPQPIFWDEGQNSMN